MLTSMSILMSHFVFPLHIEDFDYCLGIIYNKTVSTPKLYFLDELNLLLNESQ